jgi:hypothetical protein
MYLIARNHKDYKPTKVGANRRVKLPQSFANSTVVVEQVSETEVRIRLAKVIAVDDIRFVEESLTPVSDRDRKQFLSLLDNPRQPNGTRHRTI